MSDAKLGAGSVADVRKKPAGDSRKQLGVLIDPDLQAAIDMRAKAMHETVSVVVRRALRDAFAAEINRAGPPKGDPPVAGPGD